MTGITRSYPRYYMNGTLICLTLITTNKINRLTNIQPYAHNSAVAWRHDRGLGSFSASNALIYIPSRDADIDALGNKDQGSRDMLKYLKKYEHFDELRSYSSRFNADIRPLYHTERHRTGGLSIQALEYGDCRSKRNGWKVVHYSMLGLMHQRIQGVQRGVSYHILQTIDTSTPGRMGTRVNPLPATVLSP